jgi:hypothetical protein
MRRLARTVLCGRGRYAMTEGEDDMHFAALVMVLAVGPAPKTGQPLEMKLPGGAQSVTCGDAVKVKLEGHFPAGTKVQIRRDDVELADLKLTPATLAATVKLAKTALPGPVTLEATSPAGRAALVVANVNEKLRLSLQFEDGWTAALNEAQAGFYDVVWSKGTERRESHAQIAPTDGGLRINFQMSPEQQRLEQERIDAVQARFKTPELEEVQKRSDACRQLPSDQQLKCSVDAAKKAAPVREKLRQEDEKLSASIRARQPKEAWGCLQAVLHGRDGQLQGSGHCVFREIPVTAKVECLGR